VGIYGQTSSSSASTTTGITCPLNCTSINPCRNDMCSFGANNVPYCFTIIKNDATPCQIVEPTYCFLGACTGGICTPYPGSNSICNTVGSSSSLMVSWSLAIGSVILFMMLEM